MVTFILLFELIKWHKSNNPWWNVYHFYLGTSFILENMTIIKRNNMLSLNNNINDINTEEFNTIKAHCLIV